MKRKIVILELWGLGDLTFCTGFVRRALQAGHEVHLLGKPYAAALLGPSFPEVRFHTLDAPWTVFRGKYHFWKWNWKELGRVLGRLRQERFDAAVSVRRDPRDHLLMRLLGVRERYGFPKWGSDRLGLLNRPVPQTSPMQHRVEDWSELANAAGLSHGELLPPTLAPIPTPRITGLLENAQGQPVLCVHTGARIPVRRWPEPYFHTLLSRIRQHCRFHIILVPDPDGYGAGLAPLADQVADGLNLAELADLLGRSDLLLCNDSGPGHIAAALNRPVIALFGPTEPRWFRPWGAHQKVILRDYCPKRPCFDYCPFPEPYCLTRLHPDEVWPEVQKHLHDLVRECMIPSHSLNLP